MSLDFIPTVWAGRLLTALQKSLVYGQAGVANRDYEGEILASGNTVKIASIGDVTIGDYTKDTDIADPEILSDDDQSLVIDQQKYFNFYVDSIDRAQQNVNVLDEAMRRAGWQLRDAADTFLAGVMDAAVPTGNKIGSLTTPIVPTKDTRIRVSRRSQCPARRGKCPDRRTICRRAGVVSRAALKGINYTLACNHSCGNCNFCLRRIAG